MKKQHAAQMLKAQTEFQEVVEEMQTDLTARAQDAESVASELTEMRATLEETQARLQGKSERVAQLEAAHDLSVAETAELRSAVSASGADRDERGRIFYVGYSALL